MEKKDTICFLPSKNNNNNNKLADLNDKKKKTAQTFIRKKILIWDRKNSS